MKTIPLAQLLDEMFTPEQRKQIEARTNAMAAEILLAELRVQTGMSQTEVAKALGIKQPSLSKMEKQSDMKLSTLSSYTSAIGGRLKVTIELPGREPVAVVLPGAGKTAKVKPAARRPAKSPRRKVKVG